MKFTLSWLKDHLETEADLDTITATLTRIGLEVEEVIDPAAKLADFTVAHVVSAEPHPDADKLKVCMVETGRETVQVICGAPNARAGMMGVFAPPGAYVPGIDLTLKKAKIRGVESCGMLCSEREMQISDEHEGIIELPGDAPVGASFAAIAGLDDPVIDIAITPNRPDALGVAGIARDLAAAGLGRAISPDPKPLTNASGESPIAVEIADMDACPMFAGQLVRGVKNGPSPDWLQRRLRAIGLRPISALVDMTNYLTHDRGRPLHVYDASKISGAVRVRLAEAGERVAALDGKTYDCRGGECLIADDAGPLGFGGVIGGIESGSTEATVDVLIEAALFDPIRTAQTGRDHGIDSDARYRFERGVDPDFTLPGLDLATRMVLELAGGQPAGRVVAGGPTAAPAPVSFDPDRIRSLGGIDLPGTEARAILARLGFGWSPQDGGRISVSVPSWRPDIDGPADLVEEVLRIHGYDAVPSVALPRLYDVARPTLTLRQRRARRVRRRLASEGLSEAVTYSFMDDALARQFGAVESLALENPISSELDMMRPSILPNLAQAAGGSRARGQADVALFEVGPVYLGDAPDDQLLVAATLRLGRTGPRHWRDGGGEVDVFDAKRDALAALEAAGAPVDKLQVADEAPAWFHPGRSGVLRLGPKTVLAVFGELHPRVLEALDVDGPVAASEAFLDAVPKSKRKGTQARAAFGTVNLPAVDRDFAFVVDESVPADSLIRAVQSVDRQRVVAVRIFDIYAGKGMEPGVKSVALSVRLQPLKTTFTDAEIDAIAKRIVAAVKTATGGRLRQ